MQKGTKNPMRKLQEAADRGEYQLIDPLDYIIIDLLPIEGTTFAGLYPIGESVPGIIKLIEKRPGVTKGVLKSTLVSSRLRVLHVQGMTERVSKPGTTQEKGAWQKTKRGENVVKKWKEAGGGTSG